MRQQDKLGQDTSTLQIYNSSFSRTIHVLGRKVLCYVSPNRYTGLVEECTVEEVGGYVHTQKDCICVYTLNMTTQPVPSRVSENSSRCIKTNIPS